jgi:hypothetical protein
MDTPFTWKESCVIQKIIGAGGNGSKIRKKVKELKLDDDEKETLINLFVRLDVDEIVFETKIDKFKNKKVKVNLKNIEMLMKEQKNIKVDVTII